MNGCDHPFRKLISAPVDRFIVQRCAVRCETKFYVIVDYSLDPLSHVVVRGGGGIILGAGSCGTRCERAKAKGGSKNVPIGRYV